MTAQGYSTPNTTGPTVNESIVNESMMKRTTESARHALLFGLIDVDAGLTSLRNADCVIDL